MIMMKENIVEFFFLKEKLMTPEALEAAADSIIHEEFEGFIITRSDVITRQMSDAIKIIKSIKSKPAEMTTQDFVRYYNSRLEKMKNIITSRIQKDFVSINKIGGEKETYFIGMVRSVKKKGQKTTIEMEDTTGSVEILLDKTDAEVDDVVAAALIPGQDAKILYPDIPLRARHASFPI